VHDRREPLLVARLDPEYLRRRAGRDEAGLPPTKPHLERARERHSRGTDGAGQQAATDGPDHAIASMSSPSVSELALDEPARQGLVALSHDAELVDDVAPGAVS
jgi:hypothetical protein